MSGPKHYETASVGERTLMTGWIERMAAGGEQGKLAQETADSFVRLKMREEAVSRRIIAPQPVRDEELQQREDSDLPRIIFEKEPDSAAARVTFRGQAASRWIRAEKGHVDFEMYSSERFRKTKFELMTYRMDPRKVIADNSVKDLAEQEDAQFFAACETIVEANPATQDLEVSSALSRDGISRLIRSLVSDRLPVGCMVCTEELMWDLATWYADEVGEELVNRIQKEGPHNLSLFGVPCHTTIKNDIVDPDELWLFAPETYLGKSYLLQDATMVMKVEGPEIMFYTYMALGTTIAQTKGVRRMRFNRP